MLEALQTLLLSTGVVTASEIGDKTMLMAICLAARFRRPAPIIWGILVATVLNHAMAGGVGAVLATLITPEILRWILIVSFADAPAVFIGNKLAERLSMKLMRRIAAAVFAILAVAAWLGC